MHKLENLEKKYQKSANYFNRLNNFLTLPAIILTSLSSIFSFLSTSEIVGKEKQNDFLLVVAIMTAISSLLQTIGGSCQFTVKKDKFSQAANEFDSLVDKINFEILEANEEDFLNTIEEEMKRIKDNCKFLPQK